MIDKVKDIFTLSSIRSRVRVAFASIILLLAFSGATSLFELERVSHDTEEILRASKTTTDLAREMVYALNEQNDAIIEMAVIGGNLVDITPHYNRCVESIEKLNSATTRAQQRMIEIGSPTLTDSLIFYTAKINDLANSYINGDVHRFTLNDEESLATPHAWYVECYKPEYVNVSRQITKFMTGSESTLGPDVNRLSNTARRAVTPVFISLVVMVVVVLMLHYFLGYYLIKPIIRINNELGDYLRYRSPFDKEIPCRDEIRSLRDRIVQLIAKLK
ncbi:MAG: hypothetical protein IIU78_00260 [Alistipes sp.]|nr:hypothetical protein [Alistipes sp.]